jgi:distribution and morphology protein 10
MLGHMSGAYAARVHKDLSLCSRFDFNVYSYESEWTMGAEWWIRRNWARPAGEPAGQADAQAEVLPAASSPPLPSDKVHGVIKARASTSNVSSTLSSRLSR